MLEWLNNVGTYLGDFVLGWSLSLHRDLVLLIVAVITALLLTVVRVFTTNQEWLKRCKRDKTRLGQLIREAKAKGDKEAVGRYKNTIQLIGMKSFKSEGLPLLVSLIPIAIVATWAFNRLAFEAPQAGKPVTVTVEFPADAHGAQVALVPQEGMKVDGNNWVRQIATETAPFDPMGRLPAPIWPILATYIPPKLADSALRDPAKLPPTTVERARWKVTCDRSDKPYPLEFRFRGETLPHELIVDGRKYFSPVGTWQDGAINLRMDVPEYKFLGLLPSIDLYWNRGVFLPMDSWILAYLIIVIPLSFLLKPILRIA
jgi:uncharacterized membrane protein (DUF106 family)